MSNNRLEPKKQTQPQTETTTYVCMCVSVEAVYMQAKRYIKLTTTYFGIDQCDGYLPCSNVTCTQTNGNVTQQL